MMKNTMRRFVAWVLMPALLFNSLFVPIASAYEDSFNIDTLIETGVEGMFDSSCGGYCIVGACAHLVIKIKLTGIEYYTIVSPKIRHAAADLVISAYDHVGEEPWKEWQETFGTAMNEVNTGPVATILSAFEGLQGGRSSSDRQDEHQSVSYKEVDIIGHPAAIIPQIATIDGDSDTDAILSDYEVPRVGSLPDISDAETVDSDPDSSGEFDLSAMIDSGLSTILDVIKARIAIIIEAFEIIETIEKIIEAFDMFTDLLEFYNNAMQILEGSTRSTVYANLANPKFRAERLFCPSDADRHGRLKAEAVSPW